MKSMKACVIGFILGTFVLVCVGYVSAKPKSNQPPHPYPLHIAAFSDVGKIDELVTAGHPIDGLDDNGVTPLYLAVNTQKKLSVAKLLALGADPDAGIDSDRSPVAIAAMNGNLQIVRLLISYKANTNAEYLGSPALHHAITYNNEEIFDLLLKQPETDIDRQATATKFTPLHVAVRHNRLKLARILLESKADPTQEDSVGNTPVDLALHDPTGKMPKLFAQFKSEKQAR